MKKQLLTLAALLALALPVLGQTPKMIEFPNVYLNPKTSIQRTITHKSEKSGAKDLQKIFGIENYEQGWVFIPNHEKPDSSRWINITSRMYANGEGFEVDTLQLEEIMKNNNEIVDYHFHKIPKKAQERKILNQAKKEFKRYNKLDSSITYDFLFKEGLENNLAKNAMPSVTDISYMVDNTIRYFELNPKGKISFKVCSSLGVATYCLTPNGFNFFKNMGRGNWLLFKENESPFTKIYDKNIDASKTTKKYAIQVTSDIIHVDFKTWEEFYSEEDKNRNR